MPTTKPKRRKPLPCPDDRHALVTANAAFVWSQVWLWRRRWPSLRAWTPDELASHAFEAATRAAREYRPEMGYAFVTLCGNCIRREMAHLLKWARAGKRTGTTVSLDEARSENEAGSPVALDRLLADPSPGPAAEAMAAEREAGRAGLAGRLLERLEAEWPRAAQAVRLRVLDWMGLREAGEAMGVSKERARQLAEKGLERLRLIAAEGGVR